jgi:hypothetical protein
VKQQRVRDQEERLQLCQKREADHDEDDGCEDALNVDGGTSIDVGLNSSIFEPESDHGGEAFGDREVDPGRRIGCLSGCDLSEIRTLGLR